MGPTCENSCCAADSGEGGQWVEDDKYMGHKVFKPPASQYFQYTKSEVQKYFQGNGLDILLIEDSILRQLLVRLVHLFRGQVLLLYKPTSIRGSPPVPIAGTPALRSFAQCGVLLFAYSASWILEPCIKVDRY